MKYMLSALLGLLAGYLICAYSHRVDKEMWMSIGMDTTIKAIHRAVDDGVSCIITSPIDGSEIRLISSSKGMVVRCKKNLNLTNY